MLSPPTVQLTCDYLIQISKCEKEIETIRQYLCEQTEFIPFSIFQRLIINGSNAINSENIFQFLNSLGFNNTLEQCQLLIYFYDLDSDQSISYSEFLTAILPKENTRLRIVASQRVPDDYLQAGKQVSYDIEYSLGKLFHQEICNQLILDEIKGSLEQRLDYSVAKIFQMINIYEKQFLDEKDIGQFLKSNQIQLQEDQIQAIIKRLDRDNDGLVTLTDFKKQIERFNYQVLYSYQKNERDKGTLFTKEREKDKDQQILERNFDSCQSYTYTKGDVDRMKVETQPGVINTQNTPSYKNLNSNSNNNNNNSNHKIIPDVQGERNHSPLLKLNRIEDYYAKLQEEQRNREVEKIRIEHDIISKESSSPNKNRYKYEEDRYQMKEKKIKELQMQNEMKMKQELEKIERQQLYENKREELEQELNRSHEKIHFEEIEKEKNQQLNALQQQLEIEQEILKQKKMQQEVVQQQEEYLYKQQLKAKVQQHKDLSQRILNNLDSKKKSYEDDYQQNYNEDNNNHSKEYLNKNNYEKYLNENSSIRKSSGKKQQRSSSKNYSKYFTPNQQMSNYSASKSISGKKSISTKTPQTSIQKNKSADRIYSNQKPHILQSAPDSNKKSRQHLIELLSQQKQMGQQSQQQQQIQQQLQQPIPNYSSVQYRYSVDNKEISSKINKSGNKYDGFKASIRGQIAAQKNKERGQEIPIAQILQIQEQQSKQQLLQYYSQKKNNSRNHTPIKQAQHSSQKKVPMSFSKVPISNENRSAHKTVGSTPNSKNKSTQKTRPISYSKQPEESDQTQSYQPNEIDYSQQQADFEQSSAKKQAQKQTNQVIMDLIQEVMFQEKKVERSRQDLALRPDFNLLDCFSYIDIQKNGWINKPLFESFRRELGVEASWEDADLLIKRISHNTDKIRYEDFVKALVPKQSEYATLLNKREPTCPSENLRLSEIYSLETMKLMVQLFKNLLDYEHTMKDIRINLAKNKQLGYRALFNALDFDEDGFISLKEIQYFFQKTGQVCTEKEINHFIQRFDYDQDSLISYNEFLQELQLNTKL